MFLHITHQTEYRYDRDVFLEPHVIRLMPQTNPAQRLRDYKCTITPQPVTQTGGVDAQGNAYSQIWFHDLADALHVDVSATVETLRSNPFDYLLDAEQAALPVDYSVKEIEHLAPFRRQPDESNMQPLRDELHVFDVESQKSVLDLVVHLNRRLFEAVRVEPRHHGLPRSSADTLTRGVGACRDLAVVLMELLRLCGLATRFVSGYHFVADGDASHELHAWVEAYLPGVGWRGFDPTTGLAVADLHVAVASGADPLDASPIAGSFRGSNITCELTTSVNVEPWSEDEPDVASPRSNAHEGQSQQS